MATEPRALTVNDIIDERPLSSFQLMTILLCSLVLLLDGLRHAGHGILVPADFRRAGIPSDAVGTVLSAGLFGCDDRRDERLARSRSRWGASGPSRLGRSYSVFFSLLTAGADSISERVTVRFLTGLGLGGAMPNVVALASEYAPKRLQTILVLHLRGMGGGAVLASLVGGALIPIWGWRWCSTWEASCDRARHCLNQSVAECRQVLTARGGIQSVFQRFVRRIAPELSDVPLAPTARPGAGMAQSSERFAVAQLFSDGRTTGTLLLWVPFFMNLLILYFILSWLPSLSVRQACCVGRITAVMAFSIVGILGAFVQGPPHESDWRCYTTMVAEFVISLVLVVAASLIARIFL